MNKEDRSMFRTTLHLVSVTVYATILSANLLAAPNSRSFDHPLVFEPNRGQVAPEVQWLARGRGYQIFVTGDSASFAFVEGTGKAQERNAPPVSSMPTLAAASDARVTMLRMKLKGSHGWNAIGGEPT